MVASCSTSGVVCIKVNASFRIGYWSINRQIAMDVVDFLATKELAITDVKMILNKAYLYAKDKAVLK